MGVRPSGRAGGARDWRVRLACIFRSYHRTAASRRYISAASRRCISAIYLGASRLHLPRRRELRRLLLHLHRVQLRAQHRHRQLFILKLRALLRRSSDNAKVDARRTIDLVPISRRGLAPISREPLPDLACFRPASRRSVSPSAYASSPPPSPPCSRSARPRRPSAPCASQCPSDRSPPSPRRPRA